MCSPKNSCMYLAVPCPHCAVCPNVGTASPTARLTSPTALLRWWDFPK